VGDFSGLHRFWSKSVPRCGMLPQGLKRLAEKRVITVSFMESIPRG
jgi:hypothetical protein